MRYIENKNQNKKSIIIYIMWKWPKEKLDRRTRQAL